MHLLIITINHLWFSTLSVDGIIQYTKIYHHICISLQIICQHLEDNSQQEKAQHAKSGLTSTTQNHTGNKNFIN